MSAGHGTRRVVLCGAQKGGVGKSMFARGLVEVARRRGTTTAAFDGDGQVGLLLAHLGTRNREGRLEVKQDPLVGCGYFDARNDRERDKLFAVIDAGADVVVVDLPAAAYAELRDLISGGLTSVAETFAEEGWQVVVAHVISNLKGCALDAMDVVESRGPARVVVVENRLWGSDADDFYQFEGRLQEDGSLKYGAAKRMLLESGGTVMAIPTLRGRTIAYLDDFNLSFEEALVGTDGEYRGDRRRVREWLDAFATEAIGAGLL